MFPSRSRGIHRFVLVGGPFHIYSILVVFFILVCFLCVFLVSIRSEFERTCVLCPYVALYGVCQYFAVEKLSYNRKYATLRRYDFATTRNKKLSYRRDSGRYTVQSHSKSLILVPIESPYETFYC